MAELSASGPGAGPGAAGRGGAAGAAGRGAGRDPAAPATPAADPADFAAVSAAEAAAIDARAEAAAVAAQLRAARLGPAFWAPLCWLALVAGLALAAPWLGLAPADQIDWMAIAAAPGTEGHVLGTDHLGRDLLSRLVWGARVSLTVGLAAPAIGVGLGLILGIAAGYFRGWIDEVVGVAVDAWLAIPGLVILLLFSALFGGSLWMVCLSLGLLFIPTAARIARAATIRWAGAEFVTAARAMGASDLRIMTREILPNITWPMTAFVLVDIPIAIVIEGALSFLGLSVRAPTPSWGGMIAEGRELLESAPHIALIPTAAMFLTVLSFNLVGDAVRRRLAGDRAGAI
ncbi:ABC transporter permease [Rhodovulum sp. DZ06]|uniref:ABC transporter permease n=1 Tax=Rhodovulum sp. DZ06 TaxID=3425126 RepID=UPI003D327F78